MRPKTEQELFWEGQFGTDYTMRSQNLSQHRQPFLADLLKRAPGIHSVCELGANRGESLKALLDINPQLHLTGVEINPTAVEHLKTLPITAIHSSIQDFNTDERFDLVFSAGVLIHLNPNDLPMVYRKMGELSNRYVFINEYYNPHPTEISYFGHNAQLFKRDFAGEFLDLHEGLFSVVDYGFLWDRMQSAWDNTTWVLMEKQSR